MIINKAMEIEKGKKKQGGMVPVDAGCSPGEGAYRHIAYSPE